MTFEIKTPILKRQAEILQHVFHNVIHNKEPKADRIIKLCDKSRKAFNKGDILRANELLDEAESLLSTRGDAAE